MNSKSKVPVGTGGKRGPFEEWRVSPGRREGKESIVPVRSRPLNEFLEIAAAGHPVCAWNAPEPAGSRASTEAASCHGGRAPQPRPVEVVPHSCLNRCDVAPFSPPAPPREGGRPR